MDLLKKFTIKNLKLNKKRTIVTIIGIMLSVALITAVGTMFMSARASLIEYEIYAKGNFHVVFRDVDSKNINDFTLNRKVSKVLLSKNLGYSKITVYIYIFIFVVPGPGQKKPGGAQYRCRYQHYRHKKHRVYKKHYCGRHRKRLGQPFFFVRHMGHIPLKYYISHLSFCLSYHFKSQLNSFIFS